MPNESEAMPEQKLKAGKRPKVDGKKAICTRDRAGNPPQLSVDSASDEDSRDFCRMCRKVSYCAPDRQFNRVQDRDWCWPCDCRQPVHHGCVAATVNKRRKCRECGYKYKYYAYGSLFDFCWRYPCSTSLPVLAYLTAVGLSTYAAYVWYLKDRQTTFDGLKLLIMAITLFLGSTLLFSCWFSYVMGVKRRRFLRRHGQLTVFNRLSALSSNNNNNYVHVHYISSAFNGRSISAISEIYMPRRDQSSIQVPRNLENLRYLAASTPVELECVDERFVIPG